MNEILGKCEALDVTLSGVTWPDHPSLGLIPADALELSVGNLLVLPKAELIRV